MLFTVYKPLNVVLYMYYIYKTYTINIVHVLISRMYIDYRITINIWKFSIVNMFNKIFIWNIYIVQFFYLLPCTKK